MVKNADAKNKAYLEAMMFGTGNQNVNENTVKPTGDIEKNQKDYGQKKFIKP